MVHKYKALEIYPIDFYFIRNILFTYIVSFMKYNSTTDCYHKICKLIKAILKSGREQYSDNLVKVIRGLQLSKKILVTVRTKIDNSNIIG